MTAKLRTMTIPEYLASRDYEKCIPLSIWNTMDNLQHPTGRKLSSSWIMGKGFEGADIWVVPTPDK